MNASLHFLRPSRRCSLGKTAITFPPRLDLIVGHRRNFSLNSVYSKKKKKKSVANDNNNDDDRTIRDVVLEDEPSLAGANVRNRNEPRRRSPVDEMAAASSSLPRAKQRNRGGSPSPAPSSASSSAIEIEPLVERIKVRRAQASRTLLITPDMTKATNPCPRYMRHKIESLVGRLRHATLTSIVNSTKTDINGIPVSKKDVTRKSLLVEFQGESQMNELVANYAQQFIGDKVTSNPRLLYYGSQWSQTAPSSTVSSSAAAAINSLPLNETLNLCANVSEQMQTLVDATELDDAGIRTRFFLCDLIENMLQGMFPGCRIIPFGSTVSNLGRSDSDMDIVMRPKTDLQKKEAIFQAFSVRTGNEMTNQRDYAVKILSLISEVLRGALPGIADMNRILRAQIPIITFKHLYTNLCCDLSVQSMDSMLAAQLLFSYTVIDPRVRPFLYSLRRWSISRGMSSFVTNFPLSCLGLFYLMEAKVVPPMNLVLKTEMGMAESVATSIRWTSSNTSSSLEDLLRGFFAFYSTFQFERNAISVFDGERMDKSTMDGIEIENPLDREKNCAKLISQQNGTQQFYRAILEAQQSLGRERKTAEAEAVVDVGSSRVDERSKEERGINNNWGLSALIEERDYKTDVDVDSVFNDDHDESDGGNNDFILFARQDFKGGVGRLSPSKNAAVNSILTEIFEEEEEKENKPPASEHFHERNKMDDL